MTDFSNLKAGDFIDPLECGTILGKQAGDVVIPMPVDDPRYRLRLLALRQQIEADRPDLVLRERQNGLAVLTDNEKVGFSESTRETGVRKLRRAVVINQRTDTTRLSPEMQAAHAHKALVNAAVFQGARRAAAPARKSAKELLTALPAPSLDVA